MELRCERCGGKVQKNGIDKSTNEQKYICKKCGYNGRKRIYPRKEREKKKKKNPKHVNFEEIEREVLLGCLNNAGENVKWAALAFKILQVVDPKYSEGKSKTFTPDDYKRVIKEIYGEKPDEVPKE